MLQPFLSDFGPYAPMRVIRSLAATLTLVALAALLADARAALDRP